MPHVVLWSLHLRARSSLICVPVGIGWFCVVALPKTQVSSRWYHGGIPRSETASRPGVRISDVVGEGRVEYVPVAPPALGPPGPSKISSSSSKRKGKITRSPVKLPRSFEVSSPPSTPPRRSIVEDPSFASALAAPGSRGKSRQSGSDRRAAPVFQMGFP